MASDARRTMGLGEHPAEGLYLVLEEIYGVKIFHMDLGDTGSAACAVSEEFGEAILLNKRSPRWRRNHDLAHELFHLLTWKFFKHAEGICEPTEQEEKLPTCFAGNLLLPTDAVSAAISKATDAQGRVPFSKLDKVAREFDVSLESLFWRMHFLYGSFDEDKTKSLVDRAREYLKTVPPRYDPKPPLFPDRYQALAIKALQNGDISLGRFAKFLKISRKEAEHYLSGREPDYAEVSAFVA
jgi:Zn-dependent peptidase ImmA (M78 family)